MEDLMFSFIALYRFSIFLQNTRQRGGLLWLLPQGLWWRAGGLSGGASVMT